MDTKLVTLCEVCYTPPKIWNLEFEKRMLTAISIQCPYCKQYSKIPKELKQEIRRKWGMFDEKN